MAKPLSRLCRCADLSYASLMAYVGLNTVFAMIVSSILQGLHMLEKSLNLEGFLKESLKIKYALKSTGKSLKGLEKSLNSILCNRDLDQY